MRSIFFTLLALCVSIPSLQGQALQLEQIMQGEAFVGYLPEGITWSPDSKTIYFSWNPRQEMLRSTFAWSARSGLDSMTLEQLIDQPSSQLAWSTDRRQALYSRDGDILLWEADNQASKPLTLTNQRESNPVFGPQSGEIIYQSGNNLFLQNIRTGTMQQLTDLRTGQPKVEKTQSPQDRWLQQDQRQLFDVLTKRDSIEQGQARKNKAAKRRRPKTIYTQGSQINSITPSPSLRYITWRSTTEAGTTPTQVPNYVTTSGYSNELRGRAKVGHDQDRHTFQCWDRQLDTVYTLSIDSLPGIRNKPRFLAEYHRDSLPWPSQWASPKPVIFHGPIWSENDLALIEIKSLDNKDRWITVYDPASNHLRVIDHQHDEAWIGGPGISGWTGVGGAMGWVDHGQAVWYQSEVTGYSHLYRMDLRNQLPLALTSGPFEVLDVQLSQDESTFFIRANADGPFDHHFYHLPSRGGALKRITTLPGNHEVVVSPDERQLAVRYSFSNQPWELYVMDNRPGAPMKQITRSTTPAFEAYPWRQPEIVHVPADDGARVPARLYRPQNPNGAAVIFVHGAGYLQNVHQWWSSYYREYMFHNLLCDEGFTVIDLDYRASSGYGRDWRTAIYRHMGGRDLADQIDATRFLVDSLNIDPDRIGMYGGSYGGFITLMALFRHPGTFACGAALRSVTDWAHYNHPYTANILNTPVEDSLAYRRSSPIYYAEGLEDPLLILHGVLDVNVQFQDVVRLNQRLIELGKKNWEMAIFPLEDHGFVEPSSWIDEYRRIHAHFRKHLLSTDDR